MSTDLLREYRALDAAVDAIRVAAPHVPAGTVEALTRPWLQRLGELRELLGMQGAYTPTPPNRPGWFWCVLPHWAHEPQCVEVFWSTEGPRVLFAVCYVGGAGLLDGPGYEGALWGPEVPVPPVRREHVEQ